MPHIGKFGPLAYRKDLNLNVQHNVAGWYQWIRMQLFNLPSGDANTVNGFVFICGPDTNPLIQGIEWNSGFYLVPVFQYRLKVTIQINDGKTFTKGGELISKTGGIIFAWTWRETEKKFIPGFEGLIPVQMDFYNPEWFDSPPDNVFITGRGLQWPEVPPS